MNIIIIEDEKFSQLELIEKLELYTQINILNVFETISDSVKWLINNKKNVDLIFLDIELSDGISFEIFERVEIDIPIIFTTAYSEYAIKAFKLNSIDYLLKPIDSEELDFAIKKYDKLNKKVRTNYDNLRELYFKPTQSFEKRILIKIGDSYKYIDCNDIMFFYADDKYTYAVNKDENEFLIDLTLTNLEDSLNPDLFFRVSRKFILNIESIEKASKFFSGKLKVTLSMKSQHSIFVSRSRVAEFLNWMGRK